MTPPRTLRGTPFLVVLSGFGLWASGAGAQEAPTAASAVVRASATILPAIAAAPLDLHEWERLPPVSMEGVAAPEPGLAVRYVVPTSAPRSLSESQGVAAPPPVLRTVQISAPRADLREVRYTVAVLY